MLASDLVAVNHKGSVVGFYAAVTPTILITRTRLAVLNNLRTFLPDAKRAGKSLVEVFRATLTLRVIPEMEALNLCTVGRLEDLVPASG